MIDKKAQKLALVDIHDIQAWIFQLHHDMDTMKKALKQMRKDQRSMLKLFQAWYEAGEELEDEDSWYIG